MPMAPSETAATTSSRARLIAAAAALILVAPIWLVDVVPTQDGPIHLTQSAMIAWFGWGGALAEPIATFYQWNPRLEPNYTVYAILAALIYLFGDPLTAYRLYLTLYGLLFALAAYLAAKAESERPLLPFLLLLPVAFGLFTHMGFFNYTLGFAAFLAFAALLRTIGERRGVGAFLATAGALFLLGLTHLSTVVAACLLLAADGIARATASVGSAPPRAILSRLARDGAWAVGAALPALGLVAAFLIAYPSATAESADLHHSMFKVIRRLAFEYLFSFTKWEMLALAPLIAAMIYAGFGVLRRWRGADLVWPIFVVLVVLVSVLDPKTAQGIPLGERLAAYTWMGAALAIASRQPGAAAVRALAVLAAVSLAGQTALRAAAYLDWSAATRAVLDAGRSRPADTFAALDLTAPSGRQYPRLVRPGIHIHHLAAITSRGAALGSSLPSMRYYGYYPLHYTPERDFVFASPLWEEQPELVSLVPFRRANSGAPNVLILHPAGDSSVALARFHGYDDCKATEAGRRSVLVCTQRR